MHQSQLAQSLLSCSTAFSILLQGRGTYPSFHFPSDLFCGPRGQQSRQFCSFSFLLIIMRSGLLAGIRWSVCMLKSHRSFESHFLGQVLSCAYYYYYYYWEDLYSVVVNGLNCGLKVSKFEIQLCSYVYFGLIFWKGMKPLIPQQRWIKNYHCCSSTCMSLALNNRRILRCHWKKRKKHTKKQIIFNFPSCFLSTLDSYFFYIFLLQYNARNG